MSSTPIISDARFCIATKIAPISGEFSSGGLKRLDYDPEHCSEPQTDPEDSFRRWLDEFETAAPSKQWAMLDPGGTAFQRSVWQELLKIPFGTTTSYGSIAKQLGKPSASRAVGSAVGANPVCLLIPCHRVLPATGQSGNYRWGPAIKRRLLDAERVEGSDLQSLFK